MAEAPPKPEYVFQLKDDAAFKDMPPEQKLKAIVDLSAKDSHFMSMSGAGRKQIIDELLGGEQAYASAPAPDAQPAAPPADAIPTQQPGAPMPPPGSGVPNTELGLEEQTPLTTVPGRAAISVLDTPNRLLGLGVRGVQGAARGLGLMAPEGGISEESLSAFERPVENAATDNRGFPAQSPGVAILQHYVDSALGAAVGVGVVNKLMPTLQAGIPLTEQAVSATWMALRGTTAAEAAKMVGLPPWVQTGADLVAGGMSADNVKKLFSFLVKKPLGAVTDIVSGRNLQRQVEGLSDKAGEYFGGPSFVEKRTTPPGVTPPTEAANAGALERFVGEQQAPVQEATQARAIAGAQAEQAAGALDAAKEGTQTAKRVAFQAKQALQTQQDDLAKISATNEAAVNRALTEAGAGAERMVPEVAGLGEGALERGREIIQTGGEKTRQLYEAANKHFGLQADARYDALHARHPMTYQAAPINRVIEEYDADMNAAQRGTYEPSAAIAQAKKTIREKAPAIDVGAEGADELGLGGAPGTNVAGVKSDLDAAELSLKDVHMMRSRALADRRQTLNTSPQAPALDHYINKLDEAMDQMAKENPPAFAELSKLNAWYRVEKQRFTPPREAGATPSPGELAIRRDPRTGDPVLSPETIGRRSFAEGPGVAKGSEQQTRNLEFFKAHMQNLDDILATAHEDGNLALAAQVSAAREGVLDVARAKFYDAAMASGTYDKKAAEAWLQKHDALIRARPEMQQLFGDVQAAHRTIKDVAAKGQALLVQQQDMVSQAKDQMTTATRDVEEARGGLERVRQTHKDAAKAAKTAQAYEKTALETYQETFGASKTAEAALADSHVKSTLGMSADNIIQDIESMSDSSVRLRAYGAMLKKVGGDEDVKRAILYAKWKNFLGDAPAADPKKAVDFINENKPFLKMYDPEYLKNIETIQSGFARAAELKDQVPHLSLRRQGIEGVTIFAAHALGIASYHTLALATAGVEVGRVAAFARRVANLQELYTNPAAAKAIADAMRSKSPSRLATATWSVMVRSGALSADFQGENERAAPAPVSPSQP